MHLLEKEPDNRYQTADGLVHDLERVQDAEADPAQLCSGSARMISQCGCYRHRGWPGAMMRWRR